MKYRRGITTQMVSIRLKESSAKELTAIATRRGQALGTFLRELLEAYAPGDTVTDVHTLANELKAVEFVTDK